MYIYVHIAYSSFHHLCLVSRYYVYISSLMKVCCITNGQLTQQQRYFWTMLLLLFDINDRLMNMFLNLEVIGSTPGEEHGKTWGPLCYGVSSKARKCSVTLTVMYPVQPIERLAGQECLWIQVQRWPYNWHHSAKRWEHPGQRAQKNWQISVIENWARRTVESLTHGDPSSCWHTRCNCRQVTWLASQDTGNDQRGWTAPKNGASPPACSHTPRALVEPRVWE